MQFVIVNHAYDEFLDWLYKSNPWLTEQTFSTQLSNYYATLFASSDSYAHALGSLGHGVCEFVVNNIDAQRAWLEEHRPLSRRSWLARITRRSEVAISRRRQAGPPFEMLLKQVDSIRPDVIYNQSVYAFDDLQLRALKARSCLLVGEHAAMPLPDTIDYRLYDLIVSSFPPTIDWLRARGVRAELNRLAFDPRVATIVPEVDRDVRASFIGSFLAVHQSRLKLVEAVAARVPDISVHGNIMPAVSASSPLSGKIGPALWGRDMYAMLRRSIITLNHHGDVPPFANNMRLYEATGMGCLLVTDYKDNLRDMFEPEREVVTYYGAADCVDKILFYLDDRNRFAREKVATAGQRRTLHEHTYQARMRRLVDLIRTI